MRPCHLTNCGTWCEEGLLPYQSYFSKVYLHDSYSRTTFVCSIFGVLERVLVGELIQWLVRQGATWNWHTL